MASSSNAQNEKSWETFAERENFSAGQRELLKVWREIYSWLSDSEFWNEMRKLGRTS